MARILQIFNRIFDPLTEFCVFPQSLKIKLD
jgi:hypothetical protein